MTTKISLPWYVWMARIIATAFYVAGMSMAAYRMYALTIAGLPTGSDVWILVYMYGMLPAAALEVAIYRHTSRKEISYWESWRDAQRLLLLWHAFGGKEDDTVH